MPLDARQGIEAVTALRLATEEIDKMKREQAAWQADCERRILESNIASPVNCGGDLEATCKLGGDRGNGIRIECNAHQIKRERDELAQLRMDHCIALQLLSSSETRGPILVTGCADASRNGAYEFRDGRIARLDKCEA